MSSASKIVNRILGEEKNPARIPGWAERSPRDWPELMDMSDEEYEDYCFNLPIVYLDGGYRAGLDYQNNFIIDADGGDWGVRFDDEVAMDTWLASNEVSEEEEVEVDRAAHSYVWKGAQPSVPTYTLDQKRPHVVYETGGYVFLKLPHDPTFIRREGIDMQHCLSVAHEDYCRRMVGGEIEVYSQAEAETGKPVIDIEVALKKPSYNKPVKEPTVTQIRGPRNQLPPDDRHLSALVDFLTNYGGPKGWKLTGHNVVNFDGRSDGDVVMERWKELQGAQSA